MEFPLIWLLVVVATSTHHHTHTAHAQHHELYHKHALETSTKQSFQLDGQILARTPRR